MKCAWSSLDAYKALHFFFKLCFFIKNKIVFVILRQQGFYFYFSQSVCFVFCVKFELKIKAELIFFHS